MTKYDGCAIQSYRFSKSLARSDNSGIHISLINNVRLLNSVARIQTRHAKLLLTLVADFGSSGLPVGANQDLAHQDSTNEFSLFFGRISHEATSADGFLML